MTRFVPWVIAWATVLMSARVWDQIPKTLDVEPAQAVFTFAGVPLLAFALLLSSREAERRSGRRFGTGSSLVLAWVIAFFLAVHAMVLGQAIGKVESLMDVLPWAISVFFFGLGPFAVLLEPKSPMGVRTPATLGDDLHWKKTHAVLGGSFAIAGVVGLSGMLLGLDVPARIAASVLPGVVALIVAIAYGSRRPS